MHYSIVVPNGKRGWKFQLDKCNYLQYGKHEWRRFYIRIYIVLYCVLLYHVWGGGLSSTTTSVQHPLGWCDDCHSTTAPVRSPHTSYRWREERVVEPIKWMGIIRRPWLTRASGRKHGVSPLERRTVWLNVSVYLFMFCFLLQAHHWHQWCNLVGESLPW